MLPYDMANYTNHPRKPRSELSPHTRCRLVRRNGKKVREHRWMMEQHLGRKLLPTEHVHHLNGDPLDNRIENLRVMDQNAHIRLHNQIHPDKKRCSSCDTEFVVNPRHRKRNKCCSPECAMQLRIKGRKRQAESSRK